MNNHRKIFTCGNKAKDFVLLGKIKVTYFALMNEPTNYTAIRTNTCWCPATPASGIKACQIAVTIQCVTFVTLVLNLLIVGKII